MRFLGRNSDDKPGGCAAEPYLETTYARVELSPLTSIGNKAQTTLDYSHFGMSSDTVDANVV